MHLTLIRLLRKKLNELPRTAQFTELYELSCTALDLVLAQDRLNKLHHESVEQLWRENRKLYADLKLFATYLESGVYQPKSIERSLPPHVQEAMNRITNMDYHTAYGIPFVVPVENPPEDE